MQILFIFMDHMVGGSTPRESMPMWTWRAVPSRRKIVDVCIWSMHIKRVCDSCIYKDVRVHPRVKHDSWRRLGQREVETQWSNIWVHASTIVLSAIVQTCIIDIVCTRDQVGGLSCRYRHGFRLQMARIDGYFVLWLVFVRPSDNTTSTRAGPLIRGAR